MKKYFISTVLFLVSLCGIFSCKNNNDVAKLEDVKIIIKASNEITIKKNFLVIKNGVKWLDVKKQANEAIEVKEKCIAQWHLEDENGDLLDDGYEFKKDIAIFALAKEDLVKLTIKASSNITIKKPYIEVVRGTKWKDVEADSSISVPEKYIHQWKLSNENGDDLQDDYVFDVDTTIFAKAKRDTVILTLRGDENVTTTQDVIVADRNEKWEVVKEVAKEAASVPENHTIEWHLDNASGELLRDEHVFSKNAIIFAVTRKPFIDITITGDSNVVVKKNKISIEKESEWKDVRSLADEAITVAEGYTIQWKVGGTILLDSYKFLDATTIFAESSSKDLILVSPPNDWIIGKDAGCKIPSGFSKGVFIEGRKVKLSPYKIAKTETTYKFYKEVRDWAMSHGYNLGEGKNGNKGNGSDSQPVTSISWRDAIVWCNAYTEMKNGSDEECVYRKSESDSSILKDSDEKDGNKFICDTAYFDKTKKGFRLPTEAEWEYAARFQTSNDNAVKYGEVFLTKLDSASGSKKPVGFYQVEKGTSTWEELRDHLTEYAVYGKYWEGDTNDPTNFKSTGVNKTSVVGSKKPNALGLFDMSGNVTEWVFDKFGKPQKGEFKDPAIITNDKTRIVRGGSWHGEAEYCCVGSRIGASPNARLTNLGFRIAFYK